MMKIAAALVGIAAAECDGSSCQLFSMSNSGHPEAPGPELPDPKFNINTFTAVDKSVSTDTDEMAEMKKLGLVPQATVASEKTKTVSTDADEMAEMKKLGLVPQATMALAYREEVSKFTNREIFMEDHQEVMGLVINLLLIKRQQQLDKCFDDKTMHHTIADCSVITALNTNGRMWGRDPFWFEESRDPNPRNKSTFSKMQLRVFNLMAQKVNPSVFTILCCFVFETIIG